jgi:hypothetical protein
MLGGLDYLSIQAAVKRALARVGVALASLTTTGNVSVGGDLSVADDATVTGDLAVTGTAAFTGAPSGPTPAVDTNTTQLATTAFVLAQAASQAEQEAGSSTTKLVTAGRQQYHPSAAKAWAHFTNAAVINSGYNVSSITDNAGGDWTVNYTTPFSSASYAPHFMIHGGASTGAGVSLSPGHAVHTIAAGSVRVQGYGYTGSTNTGFLSDAGNSYVVCFGDQ